MNIIISNSSQKAIYTQIVDQIKNSIINGELAENDTLPSIRVLAKELGISVITTKRAYEELERGGFVVSLHGKGFYVAAQNKELLMEARLKIVEEKMQEGVVSAKKVGLNLKDINKMTEMFYEEEK